MTAPDVSIRDFIRAREIELRAELRDLIAAKAALNKRHDKVNETPTIKDMAVSCLSKRTGRGAMSEIADWILEDFGTYVPKSSLSPQLSRLALDGVVTYSDDQRIWSLTKNDFSNSGGDA